MIIYKIAIFEKAIEKFDSSKSAERKPRNLYAQCYDDLTDNVRPLRR